MLASAVAGATSGCPFCRAIFHPWPPNGTRIKILSGYDIGQEGVVLELVSASSPYLLVQMECEPSHWQRRLAPEDELYLPLSEYEAPDWMLPLAIEDALAVHQAMAQALASGGTDLQLVKAMIFACWSLRLPVEADELVTFFASHRISIRSLEDFRREFELGMDVAIGVGRRKPIKRRRMPPLSQARYLSPAAKQLRVRLFGHA